jgi:hypothetical protein
MEPTQTRQHSPPSLTPDLKAAVEARRELGPELEDQVLEAFLARVQQRIDGEVKQALAQRSGSRPAKKGANEWALVATVLGGLALMIPLMAIAGDIAGGFGVMVVVAGVVAVSFLYFIDRWVRFDKGL